MTTQVGVDRMKRQRATAMSLNLLMQKVQQAIPKNVHAAGPQVRGWIPAAHENAARHLWEVLKVHFDALTIAFSDAIEKPEGAVIEYVIRWEPA